MANWLNTGGARVAVEGAVERAVAMGPAAAAAAFAVLGHQRADPWFDHRERTAAAAEGAVPILFGRVIDVLATSAQRSQDENWAMTLRLMALWCAVGVGGIAYEKTEIPAQKRATRIVKDVPADDIAREIVEWIKK